MLQYVREDYVAARGTVGQWTNLLLLLDKLALLPRLGKMLLSSWLVLDIAIFVFTAFMEYRRDDAVPRAGNAQRPSSDCARALLSTWTASHFLCSYESRTC